MSEDILLVVRAAEFAARMHRRHRRKDAARTPYINHLAHVALLLGEAGCDAHVVAAGYLHDAIEDVRVSYETLEVEFGSDVADLVLAVTDDKKKRWPKRKQAQIDTAESAPPRVAALKMADKISNLMSLLDAPPRGWTVVEIATYMEWAHRVVSRLPDANPVLRHRYEEVRVQLLARFGEPG